MYSLFNFMPETLSAVTKVPGWNTLREGLQRNLATVVQFYQTHPMAVESDHLLVRLLQSIDVPLSQVPERYQDNVQAMSLNLSMALKMTSSIYRGQIFPGVFYGSECPEIIIAENEDFDADEVTQNWKSQVPIYVIRHPISDLGLRLPNGLNNSSDSGIAVVVINIPLLAVMYRAFRWEEVERAAAMGEGAQRSIMQFIHMFVLPNMMASHLDYVLFNRLLNMAIGIPFGEVRRPHSFPIIDYTAKLNAVDEALLEVFVKTSKDFRSMMHEVPMVSVDNLDVVMRLPRVAPTQQVVWALSIARLPALDFLTRLAKGGAGRKNRQEVNQVLQQIRMYRRNSMMKVLPPDVLVDVQTELSDIELRIGDEHGM